MLRGPILHPGPLAIWVRNATRPARRSQSRSHCDEEDLVAVVCAVQPGSLRGAPTARTRLPGVVVRRPQAVAGNGDDVRRSGLRLRGVRDLRLPRRSRAPTRDPARAVAPVVIAGPVTAAGGSGAWPLPDG